jgi:GAF domain-containing protein
MKDEFAQSVAVQGAQPEIERILYEVCQVTGMGFAAVARVTEDRWIAAQVLDRIEFGLKPGDELEISTTICNEIRQSGQQVVIDSVADDIAWRTHPVPSLYGFKSYASLPIVLNDGSFWGTVCVIDPKQRTISARQAVEALQGYAKRLGTLLSA